MAESSIEIVVEGAISFAESRFLSVLSYIFSSSRRSIIPLTRSLIAIQLTIFEV